MMAPRLVSERLWLSRQHVELFVPEEFARHIAPFQRDGVRFLYAQYAKKNPGVVLNDPPGFGKTVQCVLFADAVRHLARPLPTLVLCGEDDAAHWRYHFHMWTDSTKETLDDGVNIFSKKEVFIRPLSNISEASRREWGVVVLDIAADSKMSSLIKQLDSVKAAFKIWICSENLLNNLPKLAKMYKWLNPKETFDPSLYDKDGLTLKQQISKDIELDIVCQNMLLRRTDEKFKVDKQIQNDLFNHWLNINIINREKYFKSNITNIPANTSNPTALNPITGVRVSRKNKDATGLKIKRSKPPSDKEVEEAKKPKVVQNSLGAQPRNLAVANGMIDMSDIESGCLIRQRLPGVDIIRFRREMPGNEEGGSVSTIEITPGSAGSSGSVRIRNIANDKCGNNKVKGDGKTKAVNESVSSIEETKDDDIAESIKHDDDEIAGSVKKVDDDAIEEGDVKCGNTSNQRNVKNEVLDNAPGPSKKSRISHKNEEKSETSCSQVQLAVKKVEELANKQFKGSLLDKIF